MRAINHALTGAIIGLTVSEPAIALPASFLSHYALDIIPHFGPGIPIEQELKTRLFRNLLLMDVLLCFLLVIVLAARRPRDWLLVAACAFSAALPDAFKTNLLVDFKRGASLKQNRYQLFDKRIQWFERPIGGMVEMAWFVAAIILLKPFLG